MGNVRREQVGLHVAEEEKERKADVKSEAGARASSSAFLGPFSTKKKAIAAAATTGAYVLASAASAALASGSATWAPLLGPPLP